MRLLVGLGNPDPEHRYNRHNVGFMAVNAIVERHGLAPWRSVLKGAGAASKGTLDGEDVFLLKPMTYMNASGSVVLGAASFFKVSLSDIVVLHDEIELPPAKLKTRVGGGNRGHNGLRSISAHVGNDYRRVGIGVGRPEVRRGVDSYVLSDFGMDEWPWVDAMIGAIATNAGLIATRRDSLFEEKINVAMDANGFDDSWRRSRVVTRPH
jgi:peptidyl-tRNA hydrolase, PTH1 family